MPQVGGLKGMTNSFKVTNQVRGETETGSKSLYS